MVLFSAAEFTLFDRNSSLYMAIDLQQLITMKRIYFLSLFLTRPLYHTRAKLFILINTPTEYSREFKLFVLW